MNRNIFAVSVLALAMFSSPTAVIAADDSAALASEARSIAKEFGGKLKPELQKAMKSGGPVAAVEFCHQKAPIIAKELSEAKGWEVTRVSLKARGAMAKPDAWEEKVLNEFEVKKAAGNSPKKMEFSEIVHEDGKSTFRYMKAIGTADVCLKCHGTNIAEPIQKTLTKYYPEDKAVGFVKGDIRGAFSFSKVVK